MSLEIVSLAVTATSLHQYSELQMIKITTYFKVSLFLSLFYFIFLENLIIEQSKQQDIQVRKKQRLTANLVLKINMLYSVSHA